MRQFHRNHISSDGTLQPRIMLALEHENVQLARAFAQQMPANELAELYGQVRALLPPSDPFPGKKIHLMAMEFGPGPNGMFWGDLNGICSQFDPIRAC